MESNYVFEESYSDRTVRLTVTMDAAFFMNVQFVGRGTMGGARRFTELVDQARSMPGAHGKVSGIVNLTELTGSPLRAQVVIGRWLMGCRDAFLGIAIVGGGRIERRIAKVVTSMAQMTNVGFTETLAEGEAFLKTS